MSIKLKGLLFLVSLGIFSFISSGDHFLKPIIKGSLNSSQLTETSGIVCSIKNKGYIWAHNDSGDSPILYLLDSACNLKKTFVVNDAINFDWEDIAMHYDSASGKSFLYVADIGDNFGLMPFRTIYKIEEPYLDDDDQITGIEKMLFTYPDGPRDAETLMVSPGDARIHIISKREQNVHYYVSEFKPFINENDTATLTFKGKIPYHNVVAGDISPNGQKLLLKTYKHVYYWKPGADIYNALKNQTPVKVSTYIEEPQGEAICWNRTCDGFFTLSEKKGNNNPPLYFYPANPK